MPKLPEHSPLGGSGAYRWIQCPGSVSLSEGVIDPASDFAAEGTAAHSVAAQCLISGGDAWEKIGQKSHAGIQVSKDMADAVQVYLDAVRTRYGRSGPFAPEQFFHCPSLHKWFYGQIDLSVECGDTLDVWDYKHGAGIVVEVHDNPQLMYYAAGLLSLTAGWSKYELVRMFIAQPRGWHGDGSIRERTISTTDLFLWLHDVLLPAMKRAETSTDTTSGDHCRFCPARQRACPQLLSDADEIEEYLAMTKEKGAPALTNEQVGRFLDLGEVLKIAIKAARETGFQRAQKGAVIPGWKLAQSRSNREWRDGAEDAAKSEFGKDAYTVPEMKSPAQIDNLPKGEAFTRKYAFKPDAGLQLVKGTDTRAETGPAVKSMFKPVAKRKSK